jgi:hypothetical protein
MWCLVAELLGLVLTFTCSVRAGEKPSTDIRSRPEDAPAWAIRYGQEFWHESARTDKRTGAKPDRMAPALDLGNIIERVSYAFEADPARSSPRVNARKYLAVFDLDGIHFLAQTHDIVSAEKSLFTVRTRSVQTQQRSLYSAIDHSPPPAWVIGNTAQRLLNASAGLLEHVETKSSGVAVTWILREPLREEGNVVVEAELEGSIYSNQTTNAIRFADPTGKFWNVGSAVAVDSAGRRCQLPMHGEDSRLRIELPEYVLRAATFPLAIDPLISPELPMGDPILGAKPGDQYNPTVAVGSNLFLVAWTDGQQNSTLPGEVRGTRIDGSGNILDPNGLSLFGTGADFAAAAGNDAGFLGVARQGSYLLAVRIDLTGFVSAPFLLADKVINDGAPAGLVGRGFDYLATWAQQEYGPPLYPDGPPTPTIKRVYAKIINQTGSNGSFTVGSSVTDRIQPSVSTDGNNYLIVAYAAGGGIYGNRVSATGVALDQTDIPISATAAVNPSPRVASAGGDFLIVWEDTRNGSYDVYGARVSGAGAVLDPQGIPIARNGAAQGSPCVASSSTNYFVAWVETAQNTPGQVCAAVLDSEARVLAPGRVPINNLGLTARSAPAVAWNQDAFLLAWSSAQTPASEVNIFGARITASGTLLDTASFIISISVNEQFSPAVAFNGDKYLVVWSDSRNSATNDFDIYGTRVSNTGVVVDPAGIAIATGPERQTLPAVAANREAFLVVWQGQRICGTLVGNSGAVLNQSAIPIGPDSFTTSPAVASDGDGFLVVWEDWRNPYPTNNDIYASRVTHDGMVLDPGGFAVCSVREPQRYPSVASCAGEFLVVWEDWRHSSVSAVARDIYGARITRGGARRDGDGFPISLGTSDQRLPRVAASASNYLVVWEDFRFAPIDIYGNGSADIYGAVLNTNGVVGSPNGFLISGASNAQYRPAIAGTSNGYLVVWQDSRNLGTNGWDLYATGISITGQVSDLDGWRINEAGASRFDPQVAGNGEDTFLVVSAGPAQGYTRTTGNLLIMTGQPVIHSIAQNQSGFTVGWFAEAGKSYRLQYKASLTALTWSDLEGDVTAFGRIASKTDNTITGADQRFYRVIELP